MLSGVKRASQKSVLKIIETSRPSLTQDAIDPVIFAKVDQARPWWAVTATSTPAIATSIPKGSERVKKIKTINGPFRNVA